MSTPAGNPGGDTTAPVVAALAELPARIRVHALAKLLGRSSREVLAAVTALGADGRSVQSSIDRELALRVAESLGVIPVATESDATESRQVQAPGFQPTAQAPTRQSAGAPGSPGFSAPSPGRAAAAQPPAPEPARVIPPTPVFASASPLFLPPEPPAAPPRPVVRPKDEPEVPEVVVEDEVEDTEDADAGADDTEEGRPRRRRGRRGRGRGKGGQDDPSAEDVVEDEPKSDKPEKTDKPAKRVKAAKEEPEAEDTDEQEPAEGDDPASRRRRRRRRRRGGDAEDANGNPTEDDPPNTVVHVREVREAREREEKPESDGRDEVRSVRGSTRLEAKRQRRRDGREAGRRRAPILSEAEFLARREAVDRAMVIRERADRIQIGVLEDGVLVEHFVTSAGTGSLVGNVYLGRVQNVLPSMEAAFVDIGRGRNAVLYAGEVDWDAAGLEGKARKIEQALSTGDSVLVQVTKDPVGHKGARLTTQISLPGRFLVYVPGGGATGISRKLPENERRRLKDVLKRVVPEDAGVIIRTASEGISEEELARDVRRLQAQWQVIRDKTEGTNGVRRVNAPALVYEEPDLLVKVVRDLFTEDFSALVIQGDIAWETVDAYVRHVAPELADRVRKHVGSTDVFAEYRIDEQLLKALDRKVWLPSGGYLVIDRTEAMTVIDVNTGKFTGSGGNLEETVTRNNLESAEEIVRQLRLRDIGGIIVIDFIDMVLESNRDLVLRRLTECLGRDRTRHQVAEVTSLGLVQMTRKRVGTGLLEAFGTTCEHCKGRGVVVSTDPVSKPSSGSNGHPEPARGSNNTRRSRGRTEETKDTKPATKDAAKEAAALAAKEAVRDIAKATTKVPVADQPAAQEPAEPATQPDGGGRERSRHRTRTRAHRAESRNGTHPTEPTTAPVGGTTTATDQDDYTNGRAARSEPTVHGTPAEARSTPPADLTTASASSPYESPESPEQATATSAAQSGPAGVSGPTGPSDGPGTTAPASTSDTYGPTGVSDPQAASSGPSGPADTSGPAGVPDLPAASTGASGTSGPAGASDVSGPASGFGLPTGSAGTSGPSGSAGASGSSGSAGASDVSGPAGGFGLPTGSAGTSGLSGPAGASDGSGRAGVPDLPTASSGSPGTSGPSGSSSSAVSSGASADSSEEQDEAPAVPAPATPPRRQPRRAASRPAGPPVSMGHDG